MAIFNFIKNLFTRSSRQAHVPNVPAPPGAGQAQFGPQGGQPVERHFERQVVFGTMIEAGWQEQAALDESGQLVEGRDNLYLRVGCGHLVAGFETIRKDDRTILGVGGICCFCQEELAKPLKRGEITPHEAELLSLYCTECAARCDGCGRNVCRRHCLTFAVGDGAEMHLCPECTTAAERKRLVGQITRGFLSAFIEKDGSQNTEEGHQ